MGRFIKKGIIKNPSKTVGIDRGNFINGIVFSGNAGRLQEMDVILPSIEQYLNDGGRLTFTFLGSGIHSKKLLEMSKNFQNFNFLGYVNGDSALKTTNEHKWALLPIKGDALKYAYPSKLASYISAGCNLLCVTDTKSSLALLVKKNKIGIVVEPDVNQLINVFKQIENGYEVDNPRKNDLYITVDLAAKKLSNVINA